jgi:hypothetical protein
MTEPRAGEVVTPESVAMAFRTTYRPEAARGITVGYEVRMSDFTLRLQITDGVLTVGIGPNPAPDLVVERMSEQGIHALMTGATTPDQALADGSVRVHGDPALLHRFVETFRF